MKREDQQISAWIDQYIRGNLSEEELVAFKIKMEADPSIAEEVNHRKGLSDMLQKQQDIAAFRALQHEVEAQLVAPEPTPHTIPRRRWLRYIPAAVIALLMFSCSVLWYQLRKTQEEFANLKYDLEAQNYRDEAFQEELFEDQETNELTTQKQIKYLLRKINRLQKNNDQLEDRLSLLEGQMDDSLEAPIDMAALKMRRLADEYLTLPLLGVIEYEGKDSDPAERQLLEDAMEQFNLRNYDSAREGFEKLSEQQSEN